MAIISRESQICVERQREQGVDRLWEETKTGGRLREVGERRCEARRQRRKEGRLQEHTDEWEYLIKRNLQRSSSHSFSHTSEPSERNSWEEDSAGSLLRSCRISCRIPLAGFFFLLFLWIQLSIPHLFFFPSLGSQHLDIPYLLETFACWPLPCPPCPSHSLLPLSPPSSSLSLHFAPCLAKNTEAWRAPLTATLPATTWCGSASSLSRTADVTAWTATPYWNVCPSTPS